MRSVGWDGNWSISQLFDEPSTRPTYKANFGLTGHNGVDVAMVNGTELGAAEAGVVSGVAYDPQGYGWHVRVRTPDGREWLYAHMTRVDVTEGQWVDQGHYLGPSDNTGWSSGPLAHIGMRPPGANRANGFSGYEDPLPILEALGEVPGQVVPVDQPPEVPDAVKEILGGKLPILAAVAGVAAALWLVFD